MIEALSVSRVEPSSLRSGAAADVLGPNSLEFFVETIVVAIGEVLEFVCFITSPVVLHFSKLSLHATNLLMSLC